MLSWRSSKKNVLPPRTSDVETTTSWIHKVELLDPKLERLCTLSRQWWMARFFFTWSSSCQRLILVLRFWPLHLIFMGKLKSCQQSFYLRNSFRSLNWRSKQMKWEHQKDKKLCSKPRFSKLLKRWSLQFLEGEEGMITFQLSPIYVVSVMTTGD